MRREYDFSRAQPSRHAAELKKSVTIRLDQATITYFNALAGRRPSPTRRSSICTSEIVPPLAVG